jgi:hypothetical protein
MKTRASLSLGVLAIGLGSGAGGATAAVPAPVPAYSPGPVPKSLHTVESAAEDIIDLALRGKRGKVVATANVLRAGARGAAAKDLRAAGVPAGQITEFQRRADAVARLAPKADLARVALASNRAFAMIPGFFTRFTEPVPATVISLDYLDFEAKLRSITGNGPALRRTVRILTTTWQGLRADVIAHGGTAVAKKYDAHVAAMQRLGTNADPTATQTEAEHGLNLVDAVEKAYTG